MQRFGPDELDRAAARFKGLADGGLLRIYAFQFRPDLLLGPDVKPASTHTADAPRALQSGDVVEARPPVVAMAGPGAGGGVRNGSGGTRSTGGAGKSSRPSPAGRTRNGDRR